MIIAVAGGIGDLASFGRLDVMLQIARSCCAATRNMSELSRRL
ncbi:hypothetical protein ACNKHR_09845 [Shigella flexneri]